MGYYIQMRDSRFHVPAENKDAALEAMRAMWAPEAVEANDPRGGQWDGGKLIRRWYSWMNGTSLGNGTCSSFEEGMTDWRYPVTVDDKGNVIGIDFEGEKLGDEDHLWKAIAPFVTPDSYIEMSGEDGDFWRWYFDGSTVVEQAGKVEYG